jgi:hypothetical protein
VAFVRTDVSVELFSFIIRVERITELGTLEETSNGFQLKVTTNVVPGSFILVTLMMEAIRSSKSSVLTRATLRHVQEAGNLQSHAVDADLITPGEKSHNHEL